MSNLFAWETENGTIAVTTCVDGRDPSDEAQELIRRGQIAPTAPIVFNPILPNAPSHQWVIRGGVIAVDPTRPEPFDKRKALLAQVQSATTIVQLRQIIGEMLQ